VETTIFFFRVLGDKGYSTYAHLADIGCKSVLEKMIDEDGGGTRKSYYDTVWSNYLTEAEIKKIDIGGGLIHGDAADFAEDRSEKIILSHTSLELTNEQKKIGSSASFGMSDVLIDAHQVYIRRYAFNLLSSYFPSIPKDRLNILLNNPLITFNPETIMLKAGEPNDFIYLILTGNVEVIKDPGQINSILSTGGIAGEFSGLTRTALNETYRTMNYVNALKISSNLYAEFVMLNEAFDDIMVRIERKDFLQHIWLFNEALSYPVLSRVIAEMDLLSFDAGAKIRQGGDSGVYIVKEGGCELVANNEVLDTLGTGDFFGESTVLLKSPDLYRVKVVEDTQMYFIDGPAIDDIPIVHLKLFEVYGKRLRKMLSPDRPGVVTFQWKEEYSIGVQEIDSDHQKMFEAADRLNRAIAHGEEDFVLNDILDFLINYTREHFRREEDMMRMYSYEDLEAHSKKHAQLTEEVLSYRRKFETDKLSMDAGFTSFLSGWIVDHIMTEDRKCGAFLNKKSIY
jgi:hemerythrin